MLLGSVVLFLAAILIVGFPSFAMAQQTAPPITTTTTPPLTPEEQEEQNRLQSVIAATNLNLDETEKEVGGVVYTPRWSDVVWVEPDSLSILFAYCLPGEFAESGQEILGGFELEVLESYEIALAQGFMAWTMVIGNEDRQDRLPAAVGVVCVSDLNDAQTRVLSPQEQQQINNVVQQFTATQVTNIDQVINIINNVTTNATTTGGPVMPPPPPTNDTGGGGGGGTPTECPQGSFYNSTSGQCEYPTFDIDCPQGSFYNSTSGQCEYPELACPQGSFFNSTSGQCEYPEFTRTPDTTPPVFVHVADYSLTYTTSNPEGLRASHGVRVEDNVDGVAQLENVLEQDDVGEAITISCNPPSGSIFPVGVTTVQCTATDASGNTAQVSFTVTVVLELRPIPPSGALQGEEQQPSAPPAEEEEEQQPPVADEGAAAPPVEEEQEAATTSPPANDEGGGE
jgi:hypothetical protein